MTEAQLERRLSKIKIREKLECFIDLAMENRNARLEVLARQRYTELFGTSSGYGQVVYTRPVPKTQRKVRAVFGRNQQVLDAIRFMGAAGINRADLIKDTGFTRSQVNNAIYQLKSVQGVITTAARGLYVANEFMGIVAPTPAPRPAPQPTPQPTVVTPQKLTRQIDF
jgi:hypothetical protein